MRVAASVFAVVLLFAGVASAQTRAPASSTPTSNQIDLNSASRDQLLTLDGIGDVRADAIIRSRPFRAKTELVERHIIPEALYEKLSDKVYARPVAAAPARPAAPPPARR
ncbi:MAG: helix-hairpin-helix domain-containing protein [Proteobacteria bacterium]|nr:helix-hairpin-helix domain-containing protein [Pseudomonadota bacterium]